MANIKSESIDYTLDDTTLKNVLFYDQDTEGARPGVLVIHEWWGLNDYVRSRAESLAQLGYVALAVDMYGDGKVADSADEAGAAMNLVLGDMDAGTQRLRAALDHLKAHALCDANRTAAIGYCFGGAMVLHMARTGMAVNGVVSFHGSLGSFHTPSKGEVKARVLVAHGEDDSLIPADDISNFKAEMQAAEADYEFVGYPGALHGFTNPDADAKAKDYGLPLAYDKQTDEQSFAKMLKFFDEIF